MRKAIYPGTFDPPTLGHLNVIQRAAGKFDKLIVGVGENQLKTPFFSLEERVQFLKTITQGISNVDVISFNGLLVDFAQVHGAEVIIRGVRTLLDFEHDIVQAQMNRQLGNVETFYLVFDEKYRLISSSLVREIASHGKRLKDFVPHAIEEAVFRKLSQEKVGQK